MEIVKNKNSSYNIKDERDKILYHQRQEIENVIENVNSNLSNITYKVMKTLNEHKKSRNNFIGE
jgi:hypothetical protein